MLYVLDTSAILSSPLAMTSLPGDDLIIPLAAIEELEKKREHQELGANARLALKTLETCSSQHDITEPVDFNGGTIRIELNNIDTTGFPPSFSNSSVDNRILAVAKNSGATLLTNDVPLRLKASLVGVEARPFEPETYCVPTVEAREVDEVFLDALAGNPVDIDERTGSCLILRSPSGKSMLGRVTSGTCFAVTGRNVCGVNPKNAEQTFALDALTDPDTQIVSLGGLAGSGKTMLALAAGIDSVRRRKHHKLIVFRPIFAVGGQDLGFLPGTAEEKMQPWAAAVYDALEGFMKPSDVESLRRSGQIQVLPLTHVRGRTINGSYVVVDEAQNLDLMTLVTALTRMGTGSKVVLTHDVSQRDNLKVGATNGIVKLIGKLDGNPEFCHVTLTRSLRSRVSELVATRFGV